MEQSSCGWQRIVSTPEQPSYYQLMQLNNVNSSYDAFVHTSIISNTAFKKLAFYAPKRQRFPISCIYHR